MKKDSQGHTGEQIMGEINREMVQSLYCEEDRVEDYKEIRRRLHQKDIDDKDFAMLLRLFWEFAMPKPAQKTDVTTGGHPITSVSFDLLDSNTEELISEALENGSNRGE